MNENNLLAQLEQLTPEQYGYLGLAAIFGPLVLRLLGFKLLAMNGWELQEQRFLASNEEAYKREWIALYESIVNGAPVITPVREGVMDVELQHRLLQAARRSSE